ncbi:MAG: long-chain fatty acid--CoA ligase [Methylococcaceae bacterium]
MSSLSEVLREAVNVYRSKPAIITGDGVLSYAELDQQSDSVAAFLAGKEVDLGDRIALYSINCPQFVVAYLGIIKAGGVVVPINILLKPVEISYIIDDAGAKGFFYHADLAQNVEGLGATLSDMEFTICINGNNDSSPLDSARWENCLDFENIPPDPVLRPSEDLAVILYTSGTTGKPKGAMLTHRNLVANTASVRQAMHWRPGEDIVLIVLPLFHAFAATVGMLTPLTCGCALAPLPKFEPELVAKTIEQTVATIFLGVPSMYAVLLRLKEDRNRLFRSLRFCVSGGAAMPVEIMTQFNEKYGIPIYEGDGPTECSPVTCVNPIGGLIKPGTVGLPVPSVEMKIISDEGENLGVGEVGEIAVRGASVMKGYWNQPEETIKVFLGNWYLTGDLGSVDEEGYFSIVDRKKDLVIVNGMNVYPRVVEEVLYRLEGIREAAVIGQPDNLHGEIPIAYVAFEEGKESSSVEIRNWCKKYLGSYQIPRKFIIVSELPKNAAGKILKRQLRKDGELERGIPGTPG